MSDLPSMPDPNLPPPRDKTKKPRALKNIERAMKDEKTMKEIRELGTGLLFYDSASPAVRKRRGYARAVFEGYCEQKLGTEDPAPVDMWNKDTIVERTWESILLMAKHAEGKIGNKPKAGVLYQYKEALYWWIIRFIEDFSTIFVQWQNIANAAIHKAATTYGFETSWLQKFKLTDAELDLFWHQISEFTSGREFWKQHYIIWILIYMTAVRPGSLAVCVGYERGSILADGKTKRNEDETLRWSDVHFFRSSAGIGCKITFKFLKGYRNPNSKQIVEGKRTFTFLPLNSNRYHLDLALLLTAYAYARGLFSKHDSLESLWNGQEVNIEVDEQVRKEAVFVASAQDGKLKVKEPLRERALNPKLQDMCDATGLYQRNTMYSLRRTAIIETRRSKDTEAAQELANHVPGGTTIYSYDDESMEDVDLANERLNLSTMSRTEVRRMFEQATTARVDLDAIPFLGSMASGSSLQESLNEETLRRARADPDFATANEEVRAQYVAIEQHLMTLGVDRIFLVNEKDYTDQLRHYKDDDVQCEALLQALGDAIQKRVNALRRLKKTHKKTIKAEMLDQAKKNQKITSRKGKGTLGTRGVPSESLTELIRGTVDPSGEASRHTAAVESLDDGEEDGEDNASDEDEAADAESRDEQLDHTHEQPSQWENLPDEVMLAVEPESDDPGPTPSGRYQFMKSFLELQSIQSSNLTCLQCKLDGTVPYDKKAQLYTRWKLDQHLKQGYHARTAQLERAFNIDYGNQEGECPLCDEVCTLKNFVAHLSEDHDEQFAD